MFPPLFLSALISWLRGKTKKKTPNRFKLFIYLIVVAASCVFVITLFVPYFTTEVFFFFCWIQAALFLLSVQCDPVRDASSGGGGEKRLQAAIIYALIDFFPPPHTQTLNFSWSASFGWCQCCGGARAKNGASG